LLAIDPGISGTGWAYFKGRKLKKCGVITASRSLEWYEKIPWYCKELSEIAATVTFSFYDREVILELPTFMQSSATGRVAASTNSLVKLSMLVGAIHTTFGRTELITPQRWKGQLKKKNVEDRIRRRIPKTVARLEPRTHAWDAIGLGLYYLGKF
jgi:hypothetical protein